MRTSTFVLPVLMALVGAATFAAGAVHAQEALPNSPPAFFISEFEVTDPEALKPYREQVEATFRPFTGRFVVRGGAIALLEGDAPEGRFVVIEFENMEKAQAWYDSPAYAELKPIRHATAKSRVFILEGMAN